MENPFTHNLATNVIGKILDAERIEGRVYFSSLEHRIFTALFNEGLLTEKAMETVGLAGRFEDAKPAPEPEKAEEKLQDGIRADLGF